MAEARLRLLSAVTTTALLLVGVLLFAASGWAVGSVVIAAVLVMIGHLVTVPTPSGERLHLALGAAAALVLIVEEPFAAGAGIHARHGGRFGRVRSPRGDEHGSKVVTETVALALFTAVFYLMVGSLPPPGQGHSLDLTAITTAGLAWYVGRAATRTVVGFERDDVSIRYVWLLAIEDWSVGVSILAAGALFGLTLPEMRWWAIPVAVLPYAFSHLGVREGPRHPHHIRSDDPGAGPDSRGCRPGTRGSRGERTAELSVAVAREVGLHPRRIASSGVRGVDARHRPHHPQRACDLASRATPTRTSRAGEPRSSPRLPISNGCRFSCRSNTAHSVPRGRTGSGDTDRVEDHQDGQFVRQGGP